MVSKKPRIVIIGAGMAGLTAANKLYTSTQMFELLVVEGGTRIGGRVNSSEFCGDRIELGATWIHGIEGSPVYEIALATKSLQSPQPWECMDGFLEDPITAAEGGHLLNPSIVDPISLLFKNLMDFVQGKPLPIDSDEVVKNCVGDCGSVGAFLRRGLEEYQRLRKEDGDWGGKVLEGSNWTRKVLEESIFAMQESVQRTFTSADDLRGLDYNAEKEYVMFGGEEITIAKGYSSVIESLASVLPAGMIHLGRRVDKIEWQADGARPVRLRFSDMSTLTADHVIVTVSLGVLKRGIEQDSSMFDPPLPISKNSAISRLGYGVVNKVFLQRSDENDFPFLQMVFHPPESELKHPEIPDWIRSTSFLCPIYSNSKTALSWFAGKEAVHLESLSDEEIIDGFSTTVSNLLSSGVKFDKVLRTKWGSNPLFLGSYSYVAVGSSIEDMETLAEPLPVNASAPPLQILFAGEATHKTHYSTTHGAYFSGLREANRLLKHYNYIGV